jgi:hypothetical protein
VHDIDRLDAIEPRLNVMPLGNHVIICQFCP